MKQLGLTFEIVVASPDAEGEWDGLLDPAEYARQSAVAKAQDVSGNRPDALILAADTIVLLDGEVLEKPIDERDARSILRRLSGREHVVCTGVAATTPDNGLASGVELTEVLFRDLTDEEISGYVATGEPLDKAGAYGIQGLGATLVKGVNGCYFNVLGFPVTRLFDTLREVGLEYVFPGRLRVVEQRL